MPTIHHTLTTPLPRVAALEHNSYPAATSDAISPPLNAPDPFFRALDATLATEARPGREDFLHNQRKLLRDVRLRDMLAAVEEWRHASGTERRWWREHARWQIKIFRVNHLIPEAAAFRAAVERSRIARRPGP